FACCSFSKFSAQWQPVMVGCSRLCSISSPSPLAFMSTWIASGLYLFFALTWLVPGPPHRARACLAVESMGDHFPVDQRTQLPCAKGPLPNAECICSFGA